MHFTELKMVTFKNCNSNVLMFLFSWCTRIKLFEHV